MEGKINPYVDLKCVGNIQSGVRRLLKLYLELAWYFSLCILDLFEVATSNLPLAKETGTIIQNIYSPYINIRAVNIKQICCGMS